MARIVRVLIYEGPDEWLQRTFENNSVRGSALLSYEGGGASITEFVADPESVLTAQPVPRKVAERGGH